ncbi:hypothetical protein TNCV_4347101 [Trichonephila clavipes]|nr:hypothetical protein TNCV_4347101 [Trichonephila clavipes]
MMPIWLYRQYFAKLVLKCRYNEESNPVCDQTDEDEYNNNNNESSNCPSNADTFTALETAMEWYELQSECCPTQLLLLKKIRNLARKKRRCAMRLWIPYTLMMNGYTFSRTAFNADIAALRIVLSEFLFHADLISKATNLSDSRVAFKAISSNEAPISVDILKCQLLISDLLQGQIDIANHWIKSHCGIEGIKRGHKLCNSRTV